MELPFAVALKTGTTRGYTDNLAFGTTREFTVGAWAGNFDGTPTEGVMAMQGAAPLVRAAFVALAALYGEPSAPERPKEIVQRAVCALSGQRPGPTCPGRKLELFVPASAARLDAAPPCSFHPPHGAQRRAAVAFPEELTHWAHAHGLADANRRPESVSGVQLVYPPPGTRFELDPYRPAEAQVPPVKTLPADDRVRVTIAGKPLDEFVPSPGAHVVRVERDGEHDEALIVVR
jgi:penicillin-binding protein 1C